MRQACFGVVCLDCELFRNRVASRSDQREQNDEADDIAIRPNADSNRNDRAHRIGQRTRRVRPCQGLSVGAVFFPLGSGQAT